VQAIAIVLVTPLNFIASRLWAFARRQPAPAA
jgi:putative flippase GtrA